MTSDQITGILRIIIPVLLSMFGPAVIPDGTASSITTVLVTIGAAIWSAFVHTQASTVATVAAMGATKVSPDGKTITLLTPNLVAAAKANATLPTV